MVIPKNKLQKNLERINFITTFNMTHIRVLSKAVLNAVGHNVYAVTKSLMGGRNSALYKQDILPIKFHLNCQSAPMIYLIQCMCVQQYFAHTILKLCDRMNKRRANIRNNYLLHSVPRCCLKVHCNATNVISVTPITHVPQDVQNRFETLKRR